MENSDQVISSSTTSNPSPSSKSDENDQNYPPSVANLNRRKLGETEMLVTKKVLSELNEAIDPKFTENSLSEIPNVDPEPSSCQGDSVFETTLPYDPLTNYLSPRPRFLRYKPSKRREIFLRTVGEDSLSVSHTSSSEEEEIKMKEEEKEELELESEGKSNEIDDEGEGDKEEEIRGWTVKELLKFLLVVASLISSTLYITTMNTPSPSFEVSGAFNSGSFPILNRTSELESSPEVESILANGSNSWDEEVTTEAVSMRNFEGVSQLNNQEDAKDRGFMKENEILNGENEGGKGVYGDLIRVECTELVEEAREKLLDGGSIIEEMDEGSKNGVELLNFGDTGDRGKRKESEISKTTSVPCETSEEDEITEAPNVNGFDEDKLLSNILPVTENEYTPQMEVVEKEEGGDLEMIESNTSKSESFVLGADKISEASNINVFDENRLLSNILTAAEDEYTPQMEVVEKEEGVDLEMIESNTWKSESVLEADKITILEVITNSLSSFVEDLEKLKSELLELMHTESESVLKAVLGLSVSSAMITCLVLSFQHKKKKDDSKVPAISVSVEPLLQDPVAKAEKVITRESPVIKATCDVNGSNNKPIRNVDAFKTLLSSSHSRDEGEKFKEMYHNEAPTVQFLGEFVVGEISNSLKNKSGMKNWTIEVEDSNFPGSVEEKPVSKNMNSGPEQALSEFSATTSSPSYGSFTTKKKIVKKEVGGDGEVKSIQNPVRRSTRIRNRMVSP